MIIGKYNNTCETYFAECDHEDYEYAIDDIIAQLEDMTGDNIPIKHIVFYSAKPLQVIAETKITVI